MYQRTRSLAAPALLAVAAFLFSGGAAQAQRGGHGGGGHGGGGHAHAAGGFHTGGGGGGFRPAVGAVPAAGFSSFRPATGVAPAAGIAGFRTTTAGVVPSVGHVNGLRVGSDPVNAGLYRSYYHHYHHNYGGYGLYLPYYGFADYWPYYSLFGLGAYAAYAPYYGGLGLPAYPFGAYDSTYPLPSVATQPQVPPSADRPPPDDAAHLQLLVPENAQVLVDGAPTTQTGTAREFVSPPLGADTRYVYKVTVRYTNAQGKPVEDTRDIRFQANDWFRIDFTRPAPPQVLSTPQPAGKQ